MSDPFAGYDAWKTTPPEWHMPPAIRLVLATVAVLVWQAGVGLGWW